VGFDIAADTAGFLYITGYTVSADFPTTVNAPQPLWGRGIDIFVTKLQRAGQGFPACNGRPMPAAKGPTPVWLWWWARTEPCTWPAMREAVSGELERDPGRVRWRF